MGEDLRAEWGPLTVQRLQQWLSIWYGHIMYLCGYDSHPVARARVLVAATIMDRLAKRVLYSQ